MTPFSCALPNRTVGAGKALIRVARPAMGSLFEIYAGGEDAAALEQAAYAAFDRVDWLEQQFSHYLPDSDICRINASAYKETVPVAPNLFMLLWRLRQLSAQTEGAFDPTAGQIIRAWGLFRRGQAHGTQALLPDAALLAALAQQIGWRHVELDAAAQTIRFLTPAVELHLGAVGKGYIVQCAADYLRETGAVACALLHSGHSSIVAVGAPPDSEGWAIGIPDPNTDDRSPAVVRLCDAALSTSGSAEQSVTIQGTRYSHLLDPRTGQPVASFGSVSVLSPDATEGDALSTAFAVQGETWARTFCQYRPDIGALFLAAPPDRSSPATSVHVGCFTQP